MSGGALPPAWTPRPGAAPPRAVQRLVAVPWRHPGLILLCAVLGVLAAVAPALRHPGPVPGARGPRVEASLPTPVAEPGRALDVETLLRQAPPAAARAPQAAAAGAPRRGGVVGGLAAGLLLGLLAAAARELRGDRMRSPREAEWALGAPVLAAVPTLSARARRRMQAPAARRGTADPR